MSLISWWTNKIIPFLCSILLIKQFLYKFLFISSLLIHSFYVCWHMPWTRLLLSVYWHVFLFPPNQLELYLPQLLLVLCLYFALGIFTLKSSIQVPPQSLHECSKFRLFFSLWNFILYITVDFCFDCFISRISQNL